MARNGLTKEQQNKKDEKMENGKEGKRWNVKKKTRVSDRMQDTEREREREFKMQAWSISSMERSTSAEIGGRILLIIVK